MDRDLDGYYFRVQRGSKWQSICWSDLTEEERYKAIDGYDEAALKRFCVGLGSVIKQIGDDLDIMGGNV